MVMEVVEVDRPAWFDDFPAEKTMMAEVDKPAWFDDFPAEKTMAAKVAVCLKERVLHCPKAMVIFYFRHRDWDCDCNLGPGQHLQVYNYPA